MASFYLQEKENDMKRMLTLAGNIIYPNGYEAYNSQDTDWEMMIATDGIESEVYSRANVDIDIANGLVRIIDRGNIVREYAIENCAFVAPKIVSLISGRYRLDML